MKFLAALLLVVGLAPSAGALEITNLAVTLGGANTADALTNTGNSRLLIASSTSIELAPGAAVPDTFGSTIQFVTRYASLLSSDREGPAAGLVTTPMTSAYTITFTVDNPTGQTYQVDIDTLRQGALTWFDDDATVGATSSAQVGALTGTVDAIANAALALAAFGPTASGATGMSVFTQNGTTVTITDNALARTFTLGFTWNATTTSDNDEVAVRMGNTSGNLSTGTTADNYPGVAPLGPRTATDDGHIVTVTTTMLPEPHSGALLAFGLAVLAMRGRVERRSRG